MSDSLSRRIEAKRDELIALTQALIRIPTLNPPGENYRAICDMLKTRLTARGLVWHHPSGYLPGGGDDDRAVRRHTDLALR